MMQLVFLGGSEILCEGCDVLYMDWTMIFLFIHDSAKVTPKGKGGICSVDDVVVLLLYDSVVLIPVNMLGII